MKKHGVPTVEEMNSDTHEVHGGLGDEYFFDGLILDDFARVCGSHFRYVADWGQWLLWSGRHWQREPTQLVKFFLAQICVRVAHRHKRKVPGGRVAVIESLAQVLREVARESGIWDRDPWLLNTLTATLNLRTMDDHRHRLDDNLTKVANAAFGSGTGCPRWMEFLHTVTDGDLELQAYLQRVAGYCLSGITSEHVFFFAYGSGANGKSTFIRTLTAVLGDYAKAVSSEVFMESKHERHPTELAQMRGYRLITATEVPRNARWHETRLKELTGGEAISARFMRQDYFEYVPQFKLLIAGNHRPSLRTVDEAMRRRFHLLPFTVTVPKAQRDPDLPVKLLAERDGILQWALEGCRDWQREGLNPPAKVSAATEDYFEAQDTIGRWLGECCEQDKRFEATSKELFTSWKTWAEDNGEVTRSQRDFSQSLEDLGFRPARTKKARMFKGLKLIAPLLGDAGDAASA